MQKCRKSHGYELECLPGGRAKRRTFGEMYCAFGTWPDSAVSRCDIWHQLYEGLSDNSPLLATQTVSRDGTQGSARLYSILRLVGVHLRQLNLQHQYSVLPIPVAAQSKAWVCGRSLAGIAGSNPTESMNMSVVASVCNGPITQPEDPYRVWCVWSRNLNFEGAKHTRSVEPWK